MRRLKTIIFIFCFALMVVALNSCLDPVGEFPDETGTESRKDISGSWQIKEAYRNKVSVFELMDFSKFRVNFLSDHTYQIENYLPFVVKENGDWHLDDPKYPFFITFKSMNGEEISTKLDYPIVEGHREIKLSFSPGCSNNEYVYVLERVVE